MTRWTLVTILWMVALSDRVLAQATLEFDLNLAPDLLQKGASIPVEVEQDGYTFHLETDGSGRTAFISLDRDLAGLPLTLSIGEGPSHLSSLVGQKFVYAEDPGMVDDLTLVYSSPLARTVSFAPTGNPNGPGGSGSLNGPPVQSDGVNGDVLLHLTQSDGTMVVQIAFLRAVEAVERYFAFHESVTPCGVEEAILIRSTLDYPVVNQGRIFLYLDPEQVFFCLVSRICGWPRAPGDRQGCDTGRS